MHEERWRISYGLATMELVGFEKRVYKPACLLETAATRGKYGMQHGESDYYMRLSYAKAG